MTYVQYVSQSCRKEKKAMSLNHTITISINCTTRFHPVLHTSYIRDYWLTNVQYSVYWSNTTIFIGRT